MTPTVLVLAFVTLQRLGELFLARRNTARLLERGALEVAPGHYPLVVGLHTLWLGGLWVLALTRGLSPDLLLLAIFIVLQGLRVWVLATLGPRWTTRILVVPGERLIASGPYRYLSHPNYWVVIGEILVLASLWTANAIQIEAGFSFIGLGVRPPTATWGGMIRDGFEHLFQSPWLAVYPGLCILLTVFALNLLGDGIRDAVDPRLREQ